MNRSPIATAMQIALLTMVLCTSAGAQIQATRLEGLILAGPDSPASGAVVTAKLEKTGWQSEVESDADGRYVFPALPPGVYTVSVQAKGYRPIAHTGVLLGSSMGIEENFTLLRGGSNETLTEQARPQGVKTGDPESFDSMTRRALEGLPQLDRSPAILSALQPGIQIKAGDAISSGVNGTQQASNNLSLDGMEVNDPVDPRLGQPMTAFSTDSIEQFSIVASGGQAEFGRNAGAQVMWLTRSGSNRWSGEAFEYFRNKSLMANDFFNNSANIEKPSFEQNLYGGSLGGPVIKNRTFIFGNFQRRDTSSAISRDRLVLTPEAKSGLFQWIPPNSTTVNSFDIAGNDPRKLGIDPTVAAALAALPDPNNNDIGDGLNTAGYRFNSPNDSDENQFTVRLDHKLTDKNQLFARYSWQQSKAIDSLHGADATYPGQPAGMDSQRHWGFSVGSDWALSGRTVNQVRVGYQNSKISLERPARQSGPMFLANSWSNVGDPSFPFWYNPPVMEFADNLSHVQGNHVFKAGFVFRYISQKSEDNAGVYPDVSLGLGYGNLPPASIGPSGAQISETDRLAFENLYNDLLGRMEQVTQTYYGDLQTYLPSGTGRKRDLRFMDYGFFLQDDWKIKDNLTLSLGLRYEINGVPSEDTGTQGALDKAGQITSTANISDFTLQRGSSWYQNDLVNFAPRLGFAWAPRHSTKMIVRGGYGFFFDRMAGLTSNFVDQNTPLSAQVVTLFPNLAGTDLRLSDGVPTASPGTPTPQFPATRSTSAGIFNTDFRTPRVQHFYLTFERQVLRNTMVEAGYVGQRSTKLLMNQNLNQLKIEGDFLQAFGELQRFRIDGTPVPSTNTLVRMFGSVNDAITAIGGSVLDRGEAGLGADTVDRDYFNKYSAAGISDFYLRNYTQFNQLIVGSSDGKASYDSVQLSVRHTSGPLSARANFTWSKSLDTISPLCSGCNIPLESFNTQLNRAPSNLDRYRVVNAWAVYSLPFGRDRQFGADASGFVNALLGDWDIGGIMVWETGQRFSVTSGRETARVGVDSLANYTGSRTIGEVLNQSGGVYWFTASQADQFTFPAAGETGTSGRNSFEGPGYFNLDLSMTKIFRLRGERRILFRAEAYNLLNQTQFGVPNANLSDPATFGRITSTVGNPRILQVALRFQF